MIRTLIPATALLLVLPLFASASTFEHSLAKGSKGAEVTTLQELLITKGYLQTEPSGYYGVLTAAAVSKFQLDNGLESTGALGPKTRALLNGVSTSTPKADMTVTKDTSSPFVTVTSPAKLPANTPSAILTATTSEASVCKYGKTKGAMEQTLFSTTGSTLHSTTLVGLTNGSTNTFYVSCKKAGNVSTTTPGDFEATATISVGASGAASTPAPVQGGVVTNSFWNADRTPLEPNMVEESPMELGMKFSANTAGTVTGMRFYKGVDNDGEHTGSLWSGDGVLLAHGTFTNETASGWQTLYFTTPVPIKANTTYVVSYYSETGHYAQELNYFIQPRANAPLMAPKDAGVYMYGESAFPTQSYQSNNYWVDVLFTASATASAFSATNPLGVVNVGQTASVFDAVQPTMPVVTGYTFGSHVQAVSKITVSKTPGGAMVTTLPLGTIGTIASQPQQKNGQTWWYVKFGSISGWTIADKIVFLN